MFPVYSNICAHIYTHICVQENIYMDWPGARLEFYKVLYNHHHV